MPLKPGRMGPETPDNVTPGDFAGSMAAAMEQALNDLLIADGLPELEMNDNSRETRDRRRLFVAIARGVVRHLAEQSSAVKVAVPDVPGPTRIASPTIEVTGTPWP